MSQRFFTIELLGNDRDDELAFVDRRPDDVPWPYRLACGEPLGTDRPDEIRLRLGARYPGVRLGSLLGNSIGYLLVDGAMHAAILAQPESETQALELLPFVLLNHRNRFHSRDYWIVNPLGTHDCVNREASDIQYLEPGSDDIVSIERFVLDPRRLDEAPDLFRVPEDPYQYFVSERLARAWHQRRCSNVLLHEIDQQAGG